MRLRKENILWNVLLGTGVYLIDSFRDRLSNGFDDISDRARDTYGEASRSQPGFECDSRRRPSWFEHCGSASTRGWRRRRRRYAPRASQWRRDTQQPLQ